MTDLHSHMLPGMDDGAQSPEDSLSLLRMECRQGVSQVALTSHFRADKESVRDFLRRRQKAAQQLRDALDGQDLPVTLKLGAEVFYTASLAQMDGVEALCLEGTNLLLVEFSPGLYPREAADTLYQLTRQGILPLIAHVERYAFVRNDPGLLAEWIEAGACTQMNATSLVMHARQRKLLIPMLRHNLIHVIATDTHSTAKRPPMLDKAMELVEQHCGRDTARALRRRADALFQGQMPQVPDPAPMRKFLGRWW